MTHTINSQTLQNNLNLKFYLITSYTKYQSLVQSLIHFAQIHSYHYLYETYYIQYFALSEVNVVDENIKTDNFDFKYKLIYIVFLSNIQITWLGSNAYYLSTIDFRFSLLLNKQHQIASSLLVSYYAQQMSLIAARRTQRWFIRDIREFNR